MITSTPSTVLGRVQWILRFRAVRSGLLSALVVLMPLAVVAQGPVGQSNPLPGTGSQVSDVRVTEIDGFGQLRPSQRATVMAARKDVMEGFNAVLEAVKRGDLRRELESPKLRAALGRDPGPDIERVSMTLWNMHGGLTAAGFISKTDGVIAPASNRANVGNLKEWASSLSEYFGAFRGSARTPLIKQLAKSTKKMAKAMPLALDIIAVPGR